MLDLLPPTPVFLFLQIRNNNIWSYAYPFIFYMISNEYNKKEGMYHAGLL